MFFDSCSFCGVPLPDIPIYIYMYIYIYIYIYITIIYIYIYIYIYIHICVHIERQQVSWTSITGTSTSGMTIALCAIFKCAGNFGSREEQHTHNMLRSLIINVEINNRNVCQALVFVRYLMLLLRWITIKVEMHVRNVLQALLVYCFNIELNIRNVLQAIYVERLLYALI